MGEVYFLVQISVIQAYTQQLVRTSLLDCVHDLVTHLSRMQRIYPRPR